MASKPDAGTESPSDFDESWIAIDEIESDSELDKSVLNPVSARTRSVSNLVQRIRRLKTKRTTGSNSSGDVRRHDKTGRRPQTTDNKGGIIRRLRSRSSAFANGRGTEWQNAQGGR